jgi:hypothetical protein
MTRRSLTIVVAIPVSAVIVGLILLAPHSAAQARSRKAPVTGQIRATAADPDAGGNFQENVEDGLPDGSGNIKGALAVMAHKLAPKTTFGVNVGGTRIGVLRTNSLGSGMAMFRTKVGRGPSSRVQKLSVDPRGKLIALTSPAGDEVLQGEVSDPTTPGGTQCCLDIHDQNGDQQGCDSLLPAECAAAGGIDMGPGTCEPDPCPNTGPNDGSDLGGDSETQD